MTRRMRVRRSCEARCLHVTVELHGALLVARTLRARDARPVQMGSTAGCDIAALHMPLGALDVAKATAVGFEICVQSHWPGTLEVAGTRSLLADVAAAGRPVPGWGSFAFAMPRDGRLIAEPAAGLRLTIEETGAEDLALRPRRRPGGRGILSIAAAAALHLGILGAAETGGQEATAAAEPTARTPAIVIQIDEAAHRRLGRRVEWRAAPRRRSEPPAGGTASTGATADAEPDDSPRDAAAREARSAGILAVLDRHFGADLAEQLGGDFEPISGELLDDYGRHVPSELDTMGGGWGHGIRRIGPGSGDGRDWGTVDVREHQLSDSAARGDAYVAAAYERLSRPRRASIDVETDLDQFDRAAISYDQVRGRLGMARHGLRRCFEARELDVPPSLRISFTVDVAGEIDSLAFEVDGDGDLDETCLAHALRHVRFERDGGAAEARISGFAVRL